MTIKRDNFLWVKDNKTEETTIFNLKKVNRIVGFKKRTVFYLDSGIDNYVTIDVPLGEITEVL